MPPALSTVKAEIKTWERAFRAKHDRNPTREDIKARRDIADKYSLYKKLVKAAAEGQPHAPASTSTSNGKRSGSSAAAVQPESETTAVSASEPSLGIGGDRKESPFLTPKKNKTSDRWRRPANRDEQGLAQEDGTMIAGKNPFLSPAKKTSGQTPSLLSSLQKAKGYPTAVSDPKHINPFEDDVVENKDQSTPRNRGVEGDAFKSPSKQAFLFAPSPKRLKSLLEVNSLHAPSARSAVLPSITPRTRARKRLRGEEVDDTPEKDREREGKSLKIGSRWAQARSLRLQRSSGALGDDAVRDGATDEGRDPQSIKRINVWKRNVQEETMSSHNQRTDGASNQLSDEDDDEILGPTPVKPTANHPTGVVSTGKRLFVDMLPPLDTTSHLRNPPTTSRQAGVDVSSEKLRDEAQEIELQDILMDPANNSTRTPSKVMSRFMALKPKSAGSPPTTDIDSGLTHDAPLATDIAESGLTLAQEETAPPMLDSYVDPDASDTDEEAISVVPVDIEEFEDGNIGAESQKKPEPSQTALAKEIVLSDEEEQEPNRQISDEDDRMEDGDPEPIKRSPKKLRIESYRYTLQQKIAQQRTKSQQNLFDERDLEEMQGKEDGNLDEDGLQEGSSNQPDPFQALSQLSIQSPESKVIRKTLALQEARAKAIFDARARERLRAAKRAPVYGPGEGMERGNEDEEAHGVQLDPFADEGDDDDWESDAEGWKATGLPDDDDW
ncbi:hypothetical protein NCC49_000775 [Naganishia albida]|nr:hypothetical protein NCC49_000775 [Naganishia albida]